MPQFMAQVGERTGSSNNVVKHLFPPDLRPDISYTTRVNGGFDTLTCRYRGRAHELDAYYEDWGRRKFTLWSAQHAQCWQGKIWEMRRPEKSLLELACVGYWGDLDDKHYIPPGSLGATSNDVTEDLSEVMDTIDVVLAQSFQTAVNATVVEVWLRLKVVELPRTGYLKVTLQTNSAGVPSGTTITNGGASPIPIAGGPLGYEYRWIKFSFPTGAAVTASTTYWIVLQATPESIIYDGDQIVWASKNGDGGYTSGTRAYSSDRAATWGGTGVQDNVFAVLALVSPLTVVQNVLSLNGTNLASTTARMQDQSITTVIIPDESLTGAGMIEFLLSFSDSTNRIWYGAVYEDRILEMFPRKTTIDWMTRGVDLQVTRSMSIVYNKIKVKFTISGAQQETSWASDTTYFTEFTRELIIDIGESTLTRAQAIRTAALTAFRNTVQHGSCVIPGDRDVYFFTGARARRELIRAGQTIRIQDLQPVFSGTVGGLDAKSSFLITGTRYDAARDELTLDFDFENPQFKALLGAEKAQQQLYKWQLGLFQ